MKLQYKVYGEASTSILMYPFSGVPGYRQKIGKQCYLPLLLIRISLNDTSFHISWNSFRLGVLSLSRMILIEFSLTCQLHHVWGKSAVYGIHIPRKCIDSMHFYSFPTLLKTPGRIFCKKCFLQNKSGGWNYDLLY